MQSALEAREILVESADVHPAVEKRPGLGRIVLGSFFIVMAIGVNIVFVLVAPYGFVNLGTDAPLIPLYQACSWPPLKS